MICPTGPQTQRSTVRTLTSLQYFPKVATIGTMVPRGRTVLSRFTRGVVNCKEHEDRKEPEKTYECGDEGRQRAAVVCEW